MADFNQAVTKTLQHEGGFVDDPRDAGGKTNMGITQADLPDIDIKELTMTQAVAYYSAHYWKALYSQISSQAVGEKTFDMGVLFGVGTAVRILQLTLSTTQDGIFGVNTLAAVNQSDEVSLLKSYKTNLVTHAFNVATQNPQDRVFLKGWTDRINS